MGIIGHMMKVAMAAVCACALSLMGCDACLSITGSCCKTCRDSKPCGDSCIPRSSTCNKTGGCACSAPLEALDE